LAISWNVDFYSRNASILVHSVCGVTHFPIPAILIICHQGFGRVTVDEVHDFRCGKGVM